MHHLSFDWHGPDWWNWTFGLRWSTRPWIRFVVLDLGPFCLCMEWNSKEETANEPE